MTTSLSAAGCKTTVVNSDINAQDFGRKLKNTIPFEKSYTAVFFLLKQNSIFFQTNCISFNGISLFLSSKVKAMLSNCNLFHVDEV